MVDMVDMLARAARDRTSGIRMVDAVVSGLRDNGINLTYHGQLITNASVCAGYSQRAKSGDVVACLVVGTRWLVMDKIGVVSASSSPTTDVSYSDTLPSGGGWQVSASGDMAVQVLSDGTNKIHLKRAAGSLDPVRSTTTKTSITPVATQDYASGNKNGYFDTQPVQGSWSGAPNTGCWFYDTKIMDFFNSQPGGELLMELSRADDGSGVYGPATVHLYLITYGNPPNTTPDLAMGWTVGEKLSPGEALRGRDDAITIPAAQRDGLATGQYKGIAAYTTNRYDYIVFGNCGKLYATANS